MSERRFYVPALASAGELVHLDPNETRHARVVRLQPGRSVCLFDGRGRQARAHVERVAQNAVVCRIDEVLVASDSQPRVVLVQATPKGTRLDEIVRMSTELGVAEIHLATTERVVPQRDSKRSEARLERLVRVAQSAAAQSGRAEVPLVEPPAPLLEVVSRAPRQTNRCVLWEESQTPLLNGWPGPHPCTWLVVGPEGGLSSKEIVALEEKGFTHASLGPYVLRVDTAAATAVALAMRLGRGGNAQAGRR